METGQLNHNTEPLGVFSSLDFISDTSAVKCAPMFVYVASVFVFWICRMLAVWVVAGDCWREGTPPSLLSKAKNLYAELKTGFDTLVTLVAKARSLLSLDPGCWKGLRDPVRGFLDVKNLWVQCSVTQPQDLKKKPKQPLMKRRDCSKAAEIRRTSASNHIQPESKIIHTDRKRVNIYIFFLHVNNMADWLGFIDKAV